MNRVIKFRAWDNYLGKMLEVQNLDWFTNSGCTSRAPSHLFCQLNDVSFDGVPKSRLIDDISDRFDLMQFTGLQDKNGVDIYEGDVLLCDWCFRKMSSRGYINKKKPNMIIGYSVVKFDMGEFSFDFLKTIPEHEAAYSENKQQYAYIGYTRDAHSSIQTHVKVVGNIYENPELVTNDK